MSDLASQIADLSLGFFETKVPQRVKPKLGKEWTVYSAIVQENTRNSEVTVVAAGTGSKCLGSTEISLQGDLLHDSHAEVIAKRAFRRYLLHQIVKNPENIFVNDGWNSLLRLQPEIRFHLFSTHPPCGDATISCCELKDRDNPKRIRLDQNRTGAKCVEGETPDLLGPGTQYHTSLGAIRIKPGRGIPTRSLSCSDKIVKWNFLGLQGSILASVLAEPIRLSSVTVCQEFCDVDSLSRALKSRFPQVCEESERQLDVCVTDEKIKRFPFAKTSNLSASNESSILTFLGGKKWEVEVAINGRRQGCIKKHFGTKKSRLSICRRSFAQEFVLSIGKISRRNLPQPVVQVITKSHPSSFIRYSDLKRLSPWYNEKKSRFYHLVPKYPRRSDESDHFTVEIESFDHQGEVMLYLFKALDDETDSRAEDEYKVELGKAGFNAEIVPVIEFRYDAEKLGDILETKVDRFSGIVFTSPRSVIAFAKSSCCRGDAERSKAILDMWRSKEAFSVGEKTSRLLRERLNFKPVPGSDDAGSADNLADFILKEKSAKAGDHQARDVGGHNLLFPAGNLTDDSLRQKLFDGGGIRLNKIVVYTTEMHSELLANVRKIAESEGSKSACLVFFSPSGVENVQKAVAELSVKDFWAKKHLIALGPSTAKKMDMLNLKANAVCSRPNVKSLLEALQGFLVDENKH